MPYNPENGDALEALSMQQVFSAYERSAWKSGGEVTVGSNSSAVELDVSGGEVYIEGSSVEFPSTSIQLESGHVDHPRKDVVFVDSAGNIAKATGDPSPFVPERDPDNDGDDDLSPEQTYKPKPPDMAAELPAASILAVVTIPARAASSADISATMIQDRTIPILEIQGLTQSTADSRYVQQSGGDMDGSLKATKFYETTTGSDERVATQQWVGDSATADAAKHLVDQNSDDDVEVYIGGTQPSADANTIKIWLDPA